MPDRDTRFRCFRVTLAPAAALLGLLVLAPAAMPQQPEAESAELQAAKGKITYRVYCSNCHGKEGRGDGPLAELLKVKPANLTRIAAAKDGVFSRDEVQKAIDGREKVPAHGATDMPIWGDAFQKTLQMVPSDEPAEARAERKVRELVHFLESIQERDEGAGGP